MTAFESPDFSEENNGKSVEPEPRPTSLVHGSPYMIKVFEQLAFRSAARWGDALGQLVIEINPLPAEINPSLD